MKFKNRICLGALPIIALGIITITVLNACVQKEDKAIKIINESISKHGGQLYLDKTVEVTFRKFQLKIDHRKDTFRYERNYPDSTGWVQEVFSNEITYRNVNDERQDLDKKTIDKFQNGINAMVYFIMLPYRLQDEAVLPEYLGKEMIKDVEYHKIRVIFKREGGGQDHEDVYLYWFTEDYSLDYLAYEYYSDETGRRFREAFNRRDVNGIVFQDYNNYAEEIEGDFSTIGKRFEMGELKKLSLVSLEEINVY